MCAKEMRMSIEKRHSERVDADLADLSHDCFWPAWAKEAVARQSSPRRHS